jgi:transcriptional regulator with GAF, ATPase, and Fis domain
MEPKLVVTAGPLLGAIFRIGGEICVGRETFNDISIGDPLVSRQHCRIKAEEDRFKILDSNSFNGTFVNGMPVEEQWLNHCDRITIGDSQFIFLLHSEDAAPASDPVELNERNLVTRSTIQLKKDQSLYLNPEKVAAAKSQSRVTQWLAALLKIGAIINSVRDLETLQRELLASVFEIIPAERGAILLLGTGGEEFISTYGLNRDGGFEQTVHVSLTVVRQAVKSGTAILCSDVSEHEEWKKTESLMVTQTRSLMCVPLTVFERALGAIYLSSGKAEEGFDENHLQLMLMVAAIAAVAIENARHIEWLTTENERLRADVQIEHNMIGNSQKMRAAYGFIAKVAPTDSSVLIYGESGTGKELMARAIHQNSNRAEEPFVAINCAAITETLLESELFGYEKGAFTGASAQKKGKLEMAQGGTVFLDEIGEMAPQLQAKLLRVLQEREFDRVGGTQPVKVDIRIIAATNRDLRNAIAEGSFREDLYYRLNVLSFQMPPLRERREDIPLLANYFTTKHSSRCKRAVRGVSQEAQVYLTSYDWPGNIRELENSVERAVVLGTTDLILPEDLPENILEAKLSSTEARAKYQGTITEMKKQLILKAFEQAGGVHNEAAKLLGVHPNNLYRMIRNLDLRIPPSKG